MTEFRVVLSGVICLGAIAGALVCGMMAAWSLWAERKARLERERLKEEDRRRRGQ